MSIWTSLFSGKSQRIAEQESRAVLRDEQAKNSGLIQHGRTDSLAALGEGFNAARRSYGDAIQYFEPYAKTGGKAFDMYGDAIGVNGDDGYERAVASYRASPDYERRVSEATDAVARKASALGALGSGNTMQAITDRASYLADEDFDQHLSRLDGIGRMGYDATGQMAGLTRGIADLHSNEGTAKAGVIGSYTGMGVTNNSNTAQQVAGNRMAVGNAGSQASANAWGLGMNLAKLGAGFLGGSSFV